MRFGSHIGAADTQLGKLRRAVSEHLNNNLILHCELLKALEISKVIMNAVPVRDLANGTGLQSPTNPYLPFDSWREYTEDSDTYGGICGDIQTLALQVFSAFGVETRMVTMFENVDYRAGPTNNHASTDVWLHDRWVAMDLTFGYYFQGLLSWPMVREKLLAGEDAPLITIGTGRLDPETYYVPLKRLVRFMCVVGRPEQDEIYLFGDKEGRLWDGSLMMSAEADHGSWAKSRLQTRKNLEAHWASKC